MALTKEELFPKTGFNVIAEDPFEIPEEAAYIVGTGYSTLAEAEVVALNKVAETKADQRGMGTPVFIYGAKGVVKKYGG
jgi:hypothetical protein